MLRLVWTHPPAGNVVTLLKPSFNVQARLGLDSITMLSIRQPALEVLKSLAMRQRRTIVCPAAEAGRFTIVEIKPFDAPPQA